MNLLIIGGSGLLGGRIYQYFKIKNYNVKILVKKNKKKLKKYKQQDIIKINFQKYDELLNACKGIDVIIHAAGMNAREAFRNSIKANYIKETFNKNLLKISHSTNLKKLIFISTVHVYSKFLNKTYDENSNTNNRHPYALASLKGEKALLKNTNRNLEVIILRLSNCFGRPLNADVNCWALFVNDLCKQSIINKAIRINQNPNIRRDFLDISSFLHYLNYFLNKKLKQRNNILNIGSGKSFTLNEMANIISARIKLNLGFTPSINFKKSRINQMVNSNFYLNINKLKKLKIKNYSNFTNEIDELIMFCKKNYASKF